MDALLYGYKQTGDEDDASPRAQPGSRLDQVEPDAVPPRAPGLAWHPKAAADRARYLGFLARTAACKGLLNPKQARLMVRSLKAHAQVPRQRPAAPGQQLGLFQDLGLLILSRYVSYEEEAAVAQAGVAPLPGDPSGAAQLRVWLEHSTQYQFLATRLLRDFIRYTPGKQRDPALSATLAGAMKAATNWFVQPGGRYALLGDTAIGTAPDWGYSPGWTLRD